MGKRRTTTYNGPRDAARQMLARYVSTADAARIGVDEAGLTAVWIYARSTGGEQPAAPRPRRPRRASRPVTTLSGV